MRAYVVLAHAEHLLFFFQLVDLIDQLLLLVAQAHLLDFVEAPLVCLQVVPQVVERERAQLAGLALACQVALDLCS